MTRQQTLLNGLDLATHEQAAMARPTGVGRALATYTIPIEGGMSGSPRRGGWRDRAGRRLGSGVATDREIAVVAAVLAAGREGRCPPARPVALDREAPLANARSKVGATTTAQLVWILAPRLPEPERLALEGRDERLAEERDQSRSG